MIPVPDMQWYQAPPPRWASSPAAHAGLQRRATTAADAPPTGPPPPHPLPPTVMPTRGVGTVDGSCSGGNEEPTHLLIEDVPLWAKSGSPRPHPCTTVWYNAGKDAPSTPPPLPPSAEGGAAPGQEAAGTHAAAEAHGRGPNNPPPKKNPKVDRGDSALLPSGGLGGVVQTLHAEPSPSRVRQFTIRRSIQKHDHGEGGGENWVGTPPAGRILNRFVSATGEPSGPLVHLLGPSDPPKGRQAPAWQPCGPGACGHPLPSPAPRPVAAPPPRTEGWWGKGPEADEAYYASEDGCACPPPHRIPSSPPPPPASCLVLRLKRLLSLKSV